MDDSEAVATIPNQMAEYHFCYLALGVDRDGRKMEAKIVDLKQGMADNEIYLSPGAFYQSACREIFSSTNLTLTPGLCCSRQRRRDQSSRHLDLGDRQ